MSKSEPELLLHEELLLLSLRDEKGTVERRAQMYPYALGGGILSELLLAGCIRIGDDKKATVDLIDRRGPDDPILTEAVELIANARRRKSADGWVSRFARMKRLRERIAIRLCQRGILRDSEDKVLLVFKRRIFPTINPAPERSIRERLDRAISGGGTDVSPRTATLLALSHVSGILPVHFEKRRLRERKQRIEQIARGVVTGVATRKAIRAAQAATAATIAAGASIR